MEKSYRRPRLGRPMRQRLRAFVRVVCGAAVIVAAAAVLMWLFGRESEVRFRGIVDSGAENVGPVEAARIVSIEVEPGQRVKAGDVLVRFDPATLLAEQALHEVKIRECEQNEEKLREKLEVALELVREGIIQLDRKDFEKKLDEWRAAGCPAIHHSDVFRSEYQPAYRVIADKYVAFLPLFESIDRLCREKARVVVAIEGGSASGKSTLAEMLSEIYDCNLFHMDDFFLRPEQRTPERLSEIGGNIDRERFATEILLPLERNKAVCFRRFDCGTQTLGEPIEIAPKPLTVVEGVYSTHPYLSRYYDLALFLDIAPDLQRKRIEARNTPFFAKRFFEEWIPLEERYFEGADVKARADMIIPVKEK